jgi:hypothetical protein
MTSANSIRGIAWYRKDDACPEVASRYAAVYLRIDTIEQAIQDSDVLRANIGAAGYVSPPIGWLQTTYALAARLLETRLIRLQ